MSNAKPRNRTSKLVSIAPDIVTDPVVSAKAAGLRYVSDTEPGIRRLKRRNAFAYVGADGKIIRDDDTLRRIRSLAIPPAYIEVWICSLANGHLQATGRDARGRKQYRYHPEWRRVRDENKYNRLVAFAQALPHIRDQVKNDLAVSGIPRDKVLATIVCLLERTLIRVGNEEYSRNNGSYGLTTMRNDHVTIEGAHLLFRFKGKSGIRHNIDLGDRRLARVVRRLHDLPGQELFQYEDSEKILHCINSSDVNDYLRRTAGDEFSAKDFRTWAGTVLAALALGQDEPYTSLTEARGNVVRAIDEVARRLGNTRSVCRKCYIHPAVVDSYLDGSLPEFLRELDSAAPHLATGLRAEEAAVLNLLQNRFAAGS